jgi:hypothetical protein
VNLVRAWTWEAKYGGEFVFLAHGMFFQLWHGIVILFQSACLQHCTMPVRDRRRQLGCAIYLLFKSLTCMPNTFTHISFHFRLKIFFKKLCVVI